MPFPARTIAPEQPGQINGSGYQQGVDRFAVQVIRSVEHEMRGKPASMVYEVLTIHMSRRLPGIVVDDETLRDAAARIAIGLPPL